MKNMITLFSAVLVIASMSACSSKWQQDPLAGENKVLEDGQQKPTPAESAKPVDSEAIRIDTVDSYTFIEDNDGGFTVTSRVLEPGYTSTLTIDNMADFPDANFDSTGHFTWHPKPGTVTGDGVMQIVKPLKVKVVAEKPGATIYQRTKVVNLTITKIFGAPVITSVTKSEDSMREGETMTVSVQVRDQDAGTDPKTWPVLQVLPTQGYPSLVDSISISDVSFSGNGQFVVTLKIDLSNKEVTKGFDRFGFSVRAISRYNQVSASQDVFVNVATSFAKPVCTWTQSIPATAGSEVNYQFVIYDPKGETYLNTPTFSNLPNGATVNCTNLNVSSQQCSFVWNVDKSVAPDEYDFSGEVSVSNQNSSDSHTETQDFDFKVIVGKKVKDPTDPADPADPINGPKMKLPAVLSQLQGGR